MDFNISNLKKHLGPGLGLRKSRYLLEMPVPGIEGESINILCMSAGLPQVNIKTADVWHLGRRFQIKGEIDYGGDYEISIIDDSEMKLRKMFDAWIKAIDNSKPKLGGAILGASFEVNPDPAPINFVNPDYQTDINIWQMNRTDVSSAHDAHKVYGYKLQNAYPKSVGIVTLGDENVNSLSEFSVTIAFSEFIPIYP